MRELVRATSLTGYRELTRSLGGDPDALLRRFGIDPEVAGDIDAFVDFRALVALHEATAAEVATPDFCLRLSEYQGLEILGPVAMIARHSRSVGEALDGIARFLHIYSPAMTITSVVEGERAEFRFDVVDRVRADLPGLGQIGEAGLGATLQIARLLIGPDFSPDTVFFRHRPAAPLARYQQHFGCPVEVEAPYWGAAFPAEVLDRPVAGADPQVQTLVRAYLQTLSHDSDRRLAGEVRSTIKSLLPTGHFDIGSVAGQLSLHPRTLQRRLAGEGARFEVLLDDVRRELAAHHLDASDMPLYQLARILGYANQGSLTRASLRWFGRPPGQVRRESRSRLEQLV
ncbi:AraC family transcriptional regulator [Nocardioides albidus]|uniref:AraC family transcriptional regulator n=1 Tax=Nocardioides albidus TaxID=1517589 RepID=A0A5C4WDQ1_9ACTN|nr:AraC family transcriptional regulator [Nocardioides albidus]TNM46133.1 AraC family transcriptional regulator [Nocardioides albidus]